MSSTNSVAAAAVATMALRFKEYIIANMPDTFDTKKEIDEYIKVCLNNIVKEMKAVVKMDVDKKRPMKKAKKNDDTKMDDADTVNDANTAEKAEKEAVKAKKAAEKEAVKAKKAAEKEAEKAKKAAEKEAVKAKKAAEKEAEKAKKAAEKEAEKSEKSNTDDETDEDYVPPKRRPAKKEKKEKVEKSDSDTDDAKSDEEKPKKPPTERKIFFDEMRIKIKELFPDLNSQQTTKKITDLWKTKQDRERGIDTYY
jgi:hypothetical protein